MATINFHARMPCITCGANLNRSEFRIIDGPKRVIEVRCPSGRHWVLMQISQKTWDENIGSEGIIGTPSPMDEVNKAFAESKKQIKL